jgi:hypothetical protein
MRGQDEAKAYISKHFETEFGEESRWILLVQQFNFKFQVSKRWL